MKIHPYAELFPPIDELSLRVLAKDIAENGLKQPIWTLDGQILDGRNRWNACRLANVECRSVEYTGDDPLGFVISLNLHRRQLTASQRAIVGVEIEAVRAKEAEERKSEKCKTLVSTQHRDATGKLGPRSSRVPQFSGEPGRGSESARKAAKEIGVNHDYISKAKRVAQSAPELICLVKSGELKLQDAAALAKMPESQRERAIEHRSSVRDLGRSIAKTVSNSNDTNTSNRRWSETDVVARLRKCFFEVLNDYLEHANGDFGTLLSCVNECLDEVKVAHKRGHQLPETIFPD